MTTESIIENGWLKVKLNGTIHIVIDMEKLTGIQSWVSSWWTINIYCSDSKIECNYSKEETWKQVLDEINKHL